MFLQDTWVGVKWIFELSVMIWSGVKSSVCFQSNCYGNGVLFVILVELN